MILFYSTEITPRILYITNFLLTEVLGVKVTVTSSMEEFKASELPKINYSSEKLEGITISPIRLLFEKDIRTFNCDLNNFEGLPVLFRTNSKSDFPFDLFAASFFMITRYEEYWQQPLDTHDRIKAENSIAYNHDFLHIPVVDQWALLLKKTIEKQYLGFIFPIRKYRYVPTIDVDVAYAYRFRNLARVGGATVKAIINGNFDDIKNRFRTLWLNGNDPFDTYDLFSDLFDEFGLNPVFFFLLGKYEKFDKNISPDNQGLIHLIEKINQKYEVGIHPSYGSNFDDSRLKVEIANLEKITKTKVIKSRQHFLKIKFPETYQNLLLHGITEDYTMGYASQIGFRAGTCTPFHFYDLFKETETALMVYPFQVMDDTLNQYLKLSPEEAMPKVIRLIDEVKKVNGTFISLWHNESLSEMREWAKWRNVYYHLTQAAT